ncbi:MAG: response regulator [Lachnospiraceae bacterium]|nr:response regulator [Lachnospiraceae bacterium]
MNRQEQMIRQEHIADFDSFLDENRKMINAQFHTVMLWCILAGPFIAVAVRFHLFQGVTYLTAVFISVFMIALALLHRLLLKRHASSMVTGMIALIGIDVLLIVMDSAHLTIYITWFLIPMLSLQFCDFKLYFVSVAFNYGFLVFATWHMAPYFAERRIDIATPFAYFASRLGGLTIETIVMIAAGYSLCKIMSNHYRSLIEQFRNFREEQERSHQLEDASNRAIAASEAKSAFLSNMSHEIRTPINAVLGMNEMILRESEDTNILAYSESIKIAGSTLLGIINDILDFSKIEAGKLEIVPVDYDLSSVINDLVNMIQIRADDKGLALSLDFDSTTPKLLHGDEVRIKQVITNILTNAVKYTEKGSVTFRIGYERIEEEPDSVLVNVTISDTGIGIKEEDMKKLFSEFERIEEERNRSIEGTGLGMSITKRLLEMMGSSLQVESVYGQGSAFSFSLKQRVVRWEELGDYEKSYRELIKGQKKYRERFIAPEAQILVVDDNTMNLMVFKSLLKQTRIRIDMAGSGDEGLTLAYDKKYDMIFLDHMMPEKDGIETLQEMRAAKNHPNLETPTICLTANAISGAREQYISAGFDDYLTKPIDGDQLEEMLLRYLPQEKIVESSSEDATDPGDAAAEIPALLAPLKEQPWIDLALGLKNSGDAESFFPLLKIFYTSLPEKVSEIEGFYAAGDWKNYAIKVHALKSSARIIGATAFGEEAQLLENAGKEADEDFIREHHEAFMRTFRSFEQPLAEVFEEKETDKPEADPDLMNDVFAGIGEAAEAMDCDMLQGIFAEMSGYRIPEADQALWKGLREAAAGFDYEAIKKQLEDRGT